MPNFANMGTIFDGTTLLPLWEQLDHLQREMNLADARFADTQVDTDRRRDSQHRAGTRAYITANALISRARENQQFLQQTLTTPGVNVWPHATLDVIRPSFEAATRALWILDADTTLERYRRGLSAAWEDHQESRKWFEAVAPLAPDGEQVEQQMSKIAKRAQIYRDDADELSLNWNKAKTPINLVDELRKLSFIAGDKLVAAALESTWRRLSGVQHAMAYASLLTSRRPLATRTIPGGVEVDVAMDDDSLIFDCRASFMLQAWAMRRYIDRTTTRTT